MSDEEKLAQVGRAVEEYQAAKVNLAHLTKKIETVRETYMEVADFLSNRSTAKRLYLENGRIQDRFSPEKAATYLLNESALAQLLAEHDEAERTLASLRGQMRNLGITGVE